MTRVLVAGMHRSGTSAVGGLINGLGLSVGPPELRMAPDAASNPLGHYELLPVVDLNDRILAACGAQWLAPIGIDPAAMSALAAGELGTAATRLLREELRDVTWLKDPRFCLTAPFWQQVSDEPLAVILPWRDVGEVAVSLEKRNRLPIELGHRLWGVYNDSALRFAAHVDHHLVEYRQLVEEPHGTAQALCEFIEHLGLAPSESVDAAAATIDATLRTSRPSQPNALSIAPEYEALTQILASGEARTPHITIPAPTLDEHFELASVLGWYERELGRTTHLLRRAEAESAHARSARTQADGDLTGSPPPTSIDASGEPSDERTGLPQFPHVDSPAISIVIPVYGQLAMTVRCLESIAEHTAGVDYEVIVVNDCSLDDSRAWLERVDNVRVINNEENVGFLKSVNAGAAAARGAHIILLNNDTQVTREWAASLLRVVRDNPEIGIVGSKLINSDGTLQEAGAIVWSNGTVCRFGTELDPDDFRVGYVRDVDYVSAACLLITTELWNRIGGFDERYAPAYYEDPDLAFEARRHGCRVVYQPQSQVVHHEKVSYGSSLSRTLYDRNREIFKAKWHDELGRQPPHGTLPFHAAESGRPHRVLILDQHVPTPDRDAASVRTVSIIRALRELGYAVTFVPRDRARHEPYVSHLQQLGVEVFFGNASLADLLAKRRRDIIAAIVAGPDVAPHMLPTLRAQLPGVPVAYDMTEYRALRLQRAAERGLASAAMVTATGEVERAMIRACDMTITTSAEETAHVLAAEPQALVRTVPMFQETELGQRSFSERNGVSFVGRWRHGPNQDAVRFLCDEIMPRVWEQDDSITLYLIGHGLPVDQLRDQTAGRPVQVHGSSADLSGLLGRVRVSVAPLRFGAGHHGKVVDAALRGLPVVTTPIGAEGCGPATTAFAVAEDPAELADLILRLHSDEAAWDQHAELGRSLVEEHFGIAAGRQAVDGCISSLVAQRHAATGY